MMLEHYQQTKNLLVSYAAGAAGLLLSRRRRPGARGFVHARDARGSPSAPGASGARHPRKGRRCPPRNTRPPRTPAPAAHRTARAARRRPAGRDGAAAHAARAARAADDAPVRRLLRRLVPDVLPAGRVHRGRPRRAARRARPAPGGAARSGRRRARPTPTACRCGSPARSSTCGSTPSSSSTSSPAAARASASRARRGCASSPARASSAPPRRPRWRAAGVLTGADWEDGARPPAPGRPQVVGDGGGGLRVPALTAADLRAGSDGIPGGGSRPGPPRVRCARCHVPAAGRRL